MKIFKNISIFFSLVLIFGFFQSANALTITPIRVEIEGDAGQTVRSEVTLINDRDVSQTFYSSFANFEAQGETGNPAFVEANDDLGTWMKTEPSITLKPHAQITVPFTVSIPIGAEPGGHFAALFWGTVPESKDKGQVTIGAKTGLLVLLSVHGDVKNGGGILGYDTENGKHFFTSLPVNFVYRFKNEGGDRIKPDGSLVIRNIFGGKTKNISPNLGGGNVLPGSTRKFTASWGDGNFDSSLYSNFFSRFLGKAKYEWSHFAFGRYTATLTLKGSSNSIESVSKVAVYVFPWQLLLLVILCCAIIYTLFHLHDKYIMKKARERAEAEGQIYMHPIKKQLVNLKKKVSKIKKSKN